MLPTTTGTGTRAATTLNTSPGPRSTYRYSSLMLTGSQGLNSSPPPAVQPLALRDAPPVKQLTLPGGEQSNANVKLPAPVPGKVLSAASSSMRPQAKPAVA